MFAAFRSLCVIAALLPPALAAAAEPAASRLRMTATPPLLHLAEGSRSTIRVVSSGEPPVVAASVGRVEALREIASGLYEADYVPPDSTDPQVAFVTALSDQGFGWVPVPLAGVRDLTVSANPRTLVSVSADGALFGPVPADATGRATVRVVVPPGVRWGSYRGQRIDLAVGELVLVHVVLDTAALDANARGELTVRALVVTERGAPRAGAPVTLTASEGVLGRPVEVEPGVFRARWKVEPGKVRQARVTAHLAGKPPSLATAVLERVAGPARSVALEVDRERLVAGEGDELAVTARVADVAGNLAEAPANLAASPGTILGWERVGAGLYEGRVQVPRRRSGQQALELKVVAAGSLVATRTIPLLPGPAREVKVELAQGEVRADGRAHELRVMLLDPHGNRVDAAGTLSLTALRGDLGEPARHGTGAYRVTYRAPLAADDFDEVVRARMGPLEGQTELRVRALGGGVVLGPKVGYTLGTGGLQSPAAGLELGLWTGAFGPSLGLVLEGRFFTFSSTDTLSGGTQSLRLDSEARFFGLVASLGWRRPLAGGMLWLGAGGGGVRTASKISTAGQPDLSARTWVPEAHASVSWGHRFGVGIPFGELQLGWQGDAARGPLRGALQSLTFNLGYRFDVL